MTMSSRPHTSAGSGAQISRREAFYRSMTVAAGSAFVAGVVDSVIPAAAFAERPAYLTEPTDEFKESERQRSEFRRLQLQQKAKFTVVLERFTNDSKTEEQLGDDLADLKQLCKITGGLPLGIKRDDIVKTVRRKKALGFWPTSVEYGYQALIREIDFQQSPNKDKDVGNPL